MDLRKIVAGMLFVVVLLWIIGWTSSRRQPTQAAPTVQAAPADKWHVTESQSPMDDSKTVVLALDSDDMVQGPSGAVKPTLIVRCQQKQTVLYVVTGMAASVEEDSDGGPRDSHNVGIRLDGGAAEYHAWNESEDHKALFASDLIWNEQYDSLVGTTVPKVESFEGGIIQLAKKISNANTMTFQFTPFDGTPQVARFDLRGLDTHLHELAEACGWAY